MESFRSKLPETLVDWANFVDVMANDTTLESLLRDAGTEMRMTLALDMHGMAGSLVTIERRLIQEALGPQLPIGNFPGIDDRLHQELTPEEWIRYCMSVATVECMEYERKKLLRTYDILASDHQVKDACDFQDASAIELIATTRVLAREVLGRISIPGLRTRGLGHQNTFTGHDIYIEPWRGPSLLQQPSPASTGESSSLVSPGTADSSLRRITIWR
jgi:hypothetical protein